MTIATLRAVKLMLSLIIPKLKTCVILQIPTTLSHANPKFIVPFFFFPFATLLPLPLCTAPHFPMEERVPPSSAAGDLTDEPPNRHGHGHGRRNVSSYDDSFDYSSVSRPVGSLDLTPEEDYDSNTYVVQVPKDQIYRVPPPENARIVEKYRNPMNKRRNSCCTRVCWIILVLFVIGISIGITLVILHKVYSPKGAILFIADVHVKNQSRPRYEFTMKVKNPNENVAISYENDGDAFLLFKKKKLATGKFPQLEQEGGDSKNVRITLTGSNTVVPDEVSKSMHDKKTERAVSLQLEMNLKGEMNIGFLNLWSKDMHVVCDFKVSTLRTGTKVLSQKCDTQIK